MNVDGGDRHSADNDRYWRHPYAFGRFGVIITGRVTGVCITTVGAMRITPVVRAENLHRRRLG